MLACPRYVELILVGMVVHPMEYRRPSYRANAQGEARVLNQPIGLPSAGG